MANNDVERWLADVADFAQTQLDADAALRDQVNFMLWRKQTPHVVRLLKGLADADAGLLLVIGTDVHKVLP